MNKMSEYTKKADEPTRRAIKNAPKTGVEIFIQPEVKGGASEETDTRVAQFRTAAQAALAIVRETMKKFGIKETKNDPHGFWVAANLTKPMAEALAKSPHVRGLREDPTAFGFHREGRMISYG